MIVSKTGILIAYLNKYKGEILKSFFRGHYCDVTPTENAGNAIALFQFLPSRYFYETRVLSVYEKNQGVRG